MLLFKDMIQYEEQYPGILDKYKTNYIYSWLLIRSIFYASILKELRGEPSISYLPSNKIKLLTYVFKSIVHNIKHRKYRASSGVIFRTPSSMLYNGLYISPQTDYFALLLGNENTLTILNQGYNVTFPFPRYNEYVVFEPQYLHKLMALPYYGKVCKYARDYVQCLFDYFEKKINHRFSEQTKNFVIFRLATNLASYEIKYSYYSRLFNNNSAKLLISSLLCYAGDASILCRVAREHGVITAELQHGMVSAGHHPYNHSGRLMQYDEYRQCFPNFFLSYGEWWNQQIHLPSHKLAIGNPKREEILQNTQQKYERRVILLIGQSDSTIKALSKIGYILQRYYIDKYKVMFRPHPLFVEESKKYMNPCIEWDNNTNIYTSLMKAKVVIADTSTSLFEAIGLSDFVFSRKSEMVDLTLVNNPFYRVTCADDVIDVLEGRKSYVSLNEHEFWKYNYKNNFLDFINKYID